MIAASRPTAAASTSQTSPSTSLPTALQDLAAWKPSHPHAPGNADTYEPLRKLAKPVMGFLMGLTAGTAAWPVAGLSLCSAGSALTMSPPLAFVSVLAMGRDKKIPLVASIPAACVTAATMVPLGGMVIAEGMFLLAASPILAPITAGSLALAGAYAATIEAPGATETSGTTEAPAAG